MWNRKNRHKNERNFISLNEFIILIELMFIIYELICVEGIIQEKSMKKVW